MNILDLAFRLDANTKENISLIQNANINLFKDHKLNKRKIFKNRIPKRIITEERWASFIESNSNYEFIPKDYFVKSVETDDERIKYLDESILIVSNSPPQFGVNNTNTLINFYNICINLKNTIIIVWDWDNHHHLHVSSILSALADIYLPSHKAHNYELNALCDSFLRLPASSHQWTDAYIAKNLHQIISHNRIDDVAGNFVKYQMFEIRNLQIENLNKKLKNIRFLDDIDSYWKLNEEQKLIEWIKFKCQWIIPTLNDVSTRLFDSLITGNIIIIPERFKYDECLSELNPDDCVYFSDLDILDPIPVVECAINKFNHAGEVGILRRVNFGLQNNLDKRINKIIEFCSKNFFVP